jgi:hypothetical protein
MNKSDLILNLLDPHTKSSTIPLLFSSISTRFLPGKHGHFWRASC